MTASEEQESVSVERKEPVAMSFGGWQNAEKDKYQRRRMVRCIAKVLQNRRSSLQRQQQQLSTALPLSSESHQQETAATRTSLIQVQRYATKMEHVLYVSAMTREEYSDISTLQMRLRMIANGIQSCRRSSASSRNAAWFTTTPAAAQA
mmetsp:Transcript_14454/g.20378  ORF Transcript_14454/g.20378 Transcript_14454/m.20378 type:complete len:149 (+) Transcript_14454:193-639(+)